MSNHLGNEAAGAQWLTQGHQASKWQCLLALRSELLLQCWMNQFRSHLGSSSLQSVLNCFPQHCITQPEGFSTAFLLQITPQLLHGCFPFLSLCKLLFQSCSPVPLNLKPMTRGPCLLGSFGTFGCEAGIAAWLLGLLQHLGAHVTGELVAIRLISHYPVALEIVDLVSHTLKPYMLLVWLTKSIGTWQMCLQCTWSIDLAFEQGCFPDSYIV